MFIQGLGMFEDLDSHLFNQVLQFIEIFLYKVVHQYIKFISKLPSQFHWV